MSNVFKNKINERIFYSDLDINMTVNWNRDINVRTNARSVAQSLMNIISTKKGTMPFDPDFGSSISMELFATMTPFMFSTIADDVVMAVRKYEPRVDKLDVEMKPSQTEKNTIELEITFTTMYDVNDLQTLSFSLGM